MKTKLSLAALLCAGVLYANDVAIPVGELPTSAQNFISENFKGAKATLAKKDSDSYEVSLSDGTEIDFMANGEWKEVDGKYKAIPLTFLPKELLSKVQASQSNAQIIKVEKEISGYKFQFNNNMKVYTDFDGKILGQKMDD
ncbi:PepSY-like domain-containing protein [Campylobacter sp.]|uniref:PepSY-like domain-containing protein n=1 Tax=Campylobacter sp. TaxID=205 RepID=UPI0026DD0B93|nr:PepSY-like domain-containing protein [Campylobacter sp.]MDO4674828.1 PepSY-like domain-containing protein [Campylobacter sp.]